MNKTNITKKTPLFTVFRKEKFSRFGAYKIKIIAIAIAFVLSLIIASLIAKAWPHMVIAKMAEGAFSNTAVLLYYTALLLGFGIAIVPAFKMKYWNMGANGQVLVGSLAAVLVMFYCGGTTSKVQIQSNALLILVMLLAALIASTIWAVIPSIFKVFFNTNETLFTLMMNYLAIGLVSYCNYRMTMGKKESPGVINLLTEKGWTKLGFLPVAVQQYIIPILIVTVITVIVAIYMNKTKHGYEVTVIGDSINTAKYVGMNTKWITIRTLLLSGVISGFIGFIFASCVEHSVSTTQCGGLGFTGILIAWLANFNPIIMAVISFGLAFLTKGTDKVASFYRLGSNNLSSVIIALMFFAVLISEFFIVYRIKVNDNGTKLSEFLSKIFNKKQTEEIAKMTEEKKNQSIQENNIEENINVDENSNENSLTEEQAVIEKIEEVK